MVYLQIDRNTIMILNGVEGYNEKFHPDFHTDVQSNFKKNPRLN